MAEFTTTFVCNLDTILNNDHLFIAIINFFSGEYL